MGSGEAVDPADHQSVAVPEKLKQGCQLLATIGADAADFLGPHHGAAGGGEGIELDGKVLINCRKRAYRKAFPSSKNVSKQYASIFESCLE